MKPKEVRRLPAGLKIVWGDGTQQEVPSTWLRKNCSCAVCKEMKVPLNESQPYFGRATELRKLELIGNYALGLAWSDGHNSIFSFDRILDMNR